MPRLIRLYIRHSIIGFAIAAVFVDLLFSYNIANLWHLVTHAPGGWFAAALLFIFNGLVFSGVQFGIAVMTLGDKDHKRPSGNAPAPVRLAEPIPLQTIKRGK